MTSTQLIPASYTRLVSDITRLYTNARKALVEAYWEIGRRIVEVEQSGKIKAPRGTSLLEKLSEDLSRQLDSGFSIENLRRMRRFYLDYPKQSAPTDMTWTQYVELLPLEDPAKRQILLRKAVRERLPHKELRSLVRNELIREEVAQNLQNAALKTGPAKKTERLTPRRGTLYTYRILDPKTVQPKEPGLLLVDLGFSCYRDLDAITSKTLKPEDIVESAKTSDDQYKLRAIEPRATSPAVLFTYKATVEKVVDGDTLRVVVDLGFNTRTRQYLRLRGIDCPEKDTEEGKRAADFVRVRIKTADEILLASSQSDKYDRYLADVFFVDPNGQEQYLNNLLLEKGLAVHARE